MTRLYAPPIEPLAHLSGDRFTLVLPFPTAKQRNALSPNGRQHWRSRHRATKAMKETAILLTRARLPAGHEPWTKATITYRFFWPNLIGRDLDNYITIHKPAVDGIVRGGLIVDDGWGVLSPGPSPVSELDRDRPRVEIVIERLDDERSNP